jgi:hypothetical protein
MGDPIEEDNAELHDLSPVDDGLPAYTSIEPDDY